MSGVLDPNDTEDVEIVMNDRATSKIDGWFGSLDAATLVKIMQLYNAQYVVSSADHLLRADELEVAAGPFYNLRELRGEKLRYPLYILKIAGSETDTNPTP